MKRPNQPAQTTPGLTFNFRQKMKFAAILALLISVCARADSFVAVVSEDVFDAIPGVPMTERVQKKVVTSSFLVRDAEHAKEHSGAVGKRLPTTIRYEVRDGRLWDGGRDLCAARIILAQAALRSGDVLIVLRMQNQFSSPLKIIRAVAGHPIQIWDLLLIQVQEGRVVRSEKILEKQEALRLRGELFEEPNKRTTAQRASRVADH